MNPPPTSSDLEASGMFYPASTLGSVPCCICGSPIPPNPANMCARCLRSRVDITSGLPRHAAVVHCPDCSSYLHPPRTWVRAAPESKELLSFCLRRLKPQISRSGSRLTGADFVWTEPHSKRLKLKLRVQRESLNGAILEQSHLVDLTVHDRLCDPCSRLQASPDQWQASVQLRQHVPHRRTFLYLEQLILRHGAAARAIKIRESPRGLDFFFSAQSHAKSFLEFVRAVAPIRSRHDKQLVSHDIHTSTYNYKHTFSVEIAPVCREDLVCLPPKLSHSLGNFGPLAVVTKVSSSIFLLDPFTLRNVILDADQFFRSPFKALLSGRQLVEYIVLDIDIEKEGSEVVVSGSRCCHAFAQVARVSDFGKNDNIFNVRTHLGHLLNPGDYALGYDLYAANTNDLEIDKYKGLVLPDAVLMKKSYEEKRLRRRGRARPWKLKGLNVEVDNTGNGKVDDGRDDDYEKFLRDLEENPELRFDISLYRNKEYHPSEVASTVDGDDLPSVPLHELLAELELSDSENDGNEGNGMTE